MGRGKLLFTVLACYGLSLTSCNQEPRTRVCIDWSTKTLSGESEKKLGNIGSLPDYVIEEGTVFIDKTLLLKELLETDKKIVVITAPRKFGKSFNLDMLRHFVEICNEEGEDIVPPKETNKYHFFTEGKIHLYTDVMIRRYNKSLSYRTKEYVPPPLISKHRKIIDKYMGQYPVLNIFLEFTMPAEDEETFDIFLWHFRNHVCRLVRAHTYLEDWFTDMMYETELSAGSNPSVTKEPFKSKEKDFRQLRRYKFEERNLTYSEILHGLQFLTRLLHEYYGKPSYLLIDDWISPLLDDALDGSLIGKEEREKLIKFIADFMRVTVKENPYVKQVYLSGVLSVNLEELLAPFSPDEIIHYNVFNNDLHEFYGFTENEVKDLLKYFDFAPAEIKRSLQYYKGYKFKKDSKLLLYNPWSLVVKASRDEDIRQQFWVDTSEMKLLEKWKKIDRYNRILGSLINGSSVSIEYNDMRIEYDDFLFKIDTVWGKDEKTDDKAINYIFSYLLQTGYVTMSDDPKPLEVVKNILPQRKINVRIPNKEVRDWFTRASTEYEY